MQRLGAAAWQWRGADLRGLRLPLASISSSSSLIASLSPALSRSTLLFAPPRESLVTPRTCNRSRFHGSASVHPTRPNSLSSHSPWTNFHTQRLLVIPFSWPKSSASNSKPSQTIQTRTANLPILLATYKSSSVRPVQSPLRLYERYQASHLVSKLKETGSRNFSSRVRPYFRQFQGWEGDSPRPPRISLVVRPLLFAAFVTLGSLAIAAIWRDEKRRREPWANRFGLANNRRFHDFYGWQYTTAQAVCGSLLAVNTVIFLCWTRSLRGVSSTLEHAYSWLNRYFLHYAFSGRGFPLLGSTFSHITLPHFAFNMFALFSFGQPLVDVLGPENFLACYLSAGVLSSLGGMLIKLMTTCTTPSLGASGAVLFMASLTALLWPSAQFGIIFLPFVSLPAQTMLLGIVALDISGLVLGWRMFDHGAHLAAVATGFLFVNGGAKWISEYQHYIVKVWRDMRARKL